MAKKPRIETYPKDNKIPKEGEGPRKFKWSFRYAELDGPWGWNKISMEKFLKDILNKLQDFETMSWPEIEGRNNHSISVEKLDSKAKKRLKELKLCSIKLFSLRLTNKERVFGLKEENILYILWWDPKHEVCPTEPRHT